MDMRNLTFKIDLDSASVKLKIDAMLYNLQSSWDQRQVGHWYEALKIVNDTFVREVPSVV